MPTKPEAEAGAVSGAGANQEAPDQDRQASPSSRAIPTTCIETIGGDPNTALRLSFQIKVF